MNPDRLIDNIEVLRQLKFCLNDVLSYPRLLNSPPHQLQSRYEILQEIGFNDVTANRLINYNSILSGSIHHNQCFYFLPKHINVVENVIRVAQLPITDAIEAIRYESNDSVATIYRLIMVMYLKRRLQISDHRKYAMNGRSLQSVEATIRLAEQNFDGGLESMSKVFIQYTPDQLKQLLGEKMVCGMDVLQIVGSANRNKRPFTMERLQWIKDILRQYHVPEYSVCTLHFITRMGRQVTENGFKRIARLDGATRFLRHPFITQLVEKINTFEDYAMERGLDFDVIFDDRFVE